MNAQWHNQLEQQHQFGGGGDAPLQRSALWKERGNLERELITQQVKEITAQWKEFKSLGRKYSSKRSEERGFFRWRKRQLEARWKDLPKYAPPPPLPPQTLTLTNTKHHTMTPYYPSDRYYLAQPTRAQQIARDLAELIG